MKLNQPVRLGGIALVGALALAACGSDNNSGGSSSSAGGSGSSSSSAAVSGQLNGEGSTAQKNAIDEAIASFTQTNSEAQVTYNGTGSGAGIKQFNAGQVDWAGSDSALKTAPAAGATTSEAQDAQKRCAGNPAWNLPMVVGPIAVAYNLSGVDKLVLTPDVVAQIFNGKITTWNDPAIAKLNSGATLPSTKISVFYRSDESGTTENFQKYLKGAAASAWPYDPSKTWPAKTGQGAAKSQGVAQGIKNTPGAVGYVEWSNAKDLKLGVAQIDNGGGAVELSADSAGKAITAAKVTGTGNDLTLKLDYATKQPGVYPVVLVTYEVVCSKGLDANKTALLKAFLNHLGDSSTQSDIVSIGYAQLPEEFASKVKNSINAIS